MRFPNKRLRSQCLALLLQNALPLRSAIPNAIIPQGMRRRALSKRTAAIGNSSDLKFNSPFRASAVAGSTPIGIITATIKAAAMLQHCAVLRLHGRII